MNIDENRERKEECQRKRNVNGLPASLFVSFFFANISKKEKKEQVVNLMLIRFMLSSALR